MLRLWSTVVIAAFVLTVYVNDSAGQSPDEKKLPTPGLQNRGGQVTPQSIVDLRKRLQELDRQLLLGNVGKAGDLFLDLSQHSVLQRELVSREIRLEQLMGNHEKAISLCQEALDQQPLTSSLWRILAASELALGHVDEASVANVKFIATNSNVRSSAVVGVDLFRNNGYQGIAVALIDSMRVVLQEPRLMGRVRAMGLLKTGKQKEAAQEVSLELRTNAMNSSLFRAELLGGLYNPALHTEFLNACREQARQADRNSSEVLLVVNLELAAGNGAEALTLTKELLTDPKLVAKVLGSIMPMVREVKILKNPKERAAINSYLLSVFEIMVSDRTVSRNLRRRAGKYLARSAVLAMEGGYLWSSPDETVQKVGHYLELVHKIDPNSEQLYAAQIKMVRYTRDHLGQPRVAARRLESMLLDLNLPTDGVALVRLTLGECYLAADDTSRGRTVLTSLARDPNYHTAAGHAHFHLARLDLAEGHFATARDRLAVVAMDNPAADYANEALELGLAIAEEMENPSGGPSVLAMYARSVYFDLVSKPAERRAALEHFVQTGTATLDLEEDQHLLERGRLELAKLLTDAGEYSAAIITLKDIYKWHPRGRFPAESLALQGKLYLAMGNTVQANEVWQQLLVQYPDYLFIDDVRDHLRSLP